MSARRGWIGGVTLCGWMCACAAAQTSKNPIGTKPEGTASNCSYSGSVSGGKETSTSQCVPGVTPGTDPNQIAPVPATQRFPFPGDPSAAAQKAAPTSDSPASSDPSTAASAGKRFPFPGETSATEDAGAPNTPSRAGSATPGGAASPAGNRSSPLQDAGSSGSSSSSSSSSASDPGYSSSRPAADSGDLPDDDPNAPMPTPHRNARKKLPAVKPTTPDEEEAKDLQVAGFYQNDGNFSAAYQRARDAVGLVGDDPEAHLALAEAARKLGKLDEAEQNYKKTLALDPVPKTRRVAEKALKEMSGS